MGRRYDLLPPRMRIMLYHLDQCLHSMEVHHEIQQSPRVAANAS